MENAAAGAHLHYTGEDTMTEEVEAEEKEAWKSQQINNSAQR